MASSILPGLRRVFGEAARARQSIDTQLRYKRSFLREIDIFQDLLPDDMAWLAQITRMRTVPASQVIYRQDDAIEGLFLLKQGRVRLSRTSASGKKLDLVLLEPGTFFGEMPLLGERMSNAAAEAIEDCVLCVLSQADVERLVRRTPTVAIRMLGVLGHRLTESEARLEDLAYRDVPARLASALLRLGRTRDDLIEGMTHQDLGDLIGAYRETVTKTLDEFRKNGYVTLARRHIRILDRCGLASLLDE